MTVKEWEFILSAVREKRYDLGAADDDYSNWAREVAKKFEAIVNDTLGRTT